MKKVMHQICLPIIELVMFFLILKIFGLSDHLIRRFMLLFYLFNLAFDHYSMKTKLIWQEVRCLIKSIGCLYISMVVSFSNLNSIRLFYVLFEYAIICGITFIGTLIVERYFNRLMHCFLPNRVLIIGCDDSAEQICHVYASNRFAKTKVIGIVQYGDERMKKSNSKYTKNIKKYRRDELYHLLDKEKIDTVILNLPQLENNRIDFLMCSLRGKVPHIKFVPFTNSLITYDSVVEECDDILLIVSSKDRGNVIEQFIKRAIDLLGGFVGVLLLIPLSIIVKVINIKNGDHDPIFFTQERIGKNGKPIKIYKYRSMIPNAETVLEELMASNPEIREEYLTNKKIENDPRITKVGHFLRKTSLDEFPQLINVLKGEMSLVGPRPYLPREKRDMGTFYDIVICLKPGITGMWQANGRSDVGFKERLLLDDYYYRNWSIWLDITILLKTVKAVFYGKGAI